MLISLILKETFLFIHLQLPPHFSALSLIQTSQRTCLLTPLDPPPFHSLTHHNPMFNLISLSFHLSCPGQDPQVLIASQSIPLSGLLWQPHSCLPFHSTSASPVSPLQELLPLSNLSMSARRHWIRSPLLSTLQPLSQEDLSNPTAESSTAHRCLTLPLQWEPYL